MLRRTAFLMALLLAPMAFSQVQFSSGETLLRGTLVKNDSLVRLVLNPRTRAMKTLDLAGLEAELKSYPSGTKVEICARLDLAAQKINLQGELKKIRPLAPNEATLIYTGDVKNCGCGNFGKFFESPLTGESLPNPGCDPHPEIKK